ncbi:MAG: 16S rRNA (uracil(1498)-N(3))-methyltransferase [Bacteroidetes bacterium]|nr:16S rRNA (uracil(1498)-N(3))-methyltransferase [Bacteroidota bacterium]
MNIFIASIEDKVAVLTSEESWHCAKVLRKKAGEEINIIDGKGNFYRGILTSVSEKKCIAGITSGPEAQKKRGYQLHLAIAPTKQIDRIEWMIEKAIEIGVDEISFIQCKNSERVVIKPERIRKIVESAVKQSLQAYIPKVNELLPFKQLIETSKCDQNFIAHCFESEKQSVKKINFKGKSTLILIGPEGDFALEEVEYASKNKFNSLDLGDNRLRTETAGLYVCLAASILS